MSKLGGKYHLKKSTILDIVNRLFYQHGNGLDLQIKVNYLVVNVSVIYFDKGVCHARKDFFIDLQGGDMDTIKRMTVDRMQNAIIGVGCEFEPINAWDRSIEV